MKNFLFTSLGRDVTGSNLENGIAVAAGTPAWPSPPSAQAGKYRFLPAADRLKENKD